MEIIKTKINFEDDRGVIRDILSHEDFNALTYLTTKKGAVRGNHYHPRTEQSDYIFSGSFECFTRKDFGSPIEKVVVVAGDVVKHPVGAHHAYKAMEDSEMLSFSRGPRQGEEYETDTVRLNEGEKLIN